MDTFNPLDPPICFLSPDRVKKAIDFITYEILYRKIDLKEKVTKAGCFVADNYRICDFLVQSKNELP
jgi:hypothetical protein